jgi:hypothetical protein
MIFNEIQNSRIFQFYQKRNSFFFGVLIRNQIPQTHQMVRRILEVS